MIRYISLTLLLGVTALHAQKLPEAGKNFGLDTLSIENQVSYITDNFYAIYSKGFDEAIALSEYAGQISKTQKWKDKEAFSLMCSGMANYLKGNYEKALTAYLRSSGLFDSLKHDEGIARLNNELAVFYRKQKDLDKVYECLEKSEAAAKRINNLEVLGTSYHHHGVSLSQQGDYESAVTFFEKVLAIRTELADSVGLGYIYLDFAEYEVHKGRINEALAYIEKSTKIRQKTGDAQGVAVNEVIMGETLFAAGRYEEAVVNFKKTIVLAEPIGYTDLIRYTHDMLRQSYIKLDNYVMAYQSLEQSTAFNDSLFNIDKTKAIAELQTKYDTEKKEQQILLQEAQLETNRLITTGLSGMIFLLIAIGFLQRNRLLLKQQKLLEEEKTKTREAQIEAALNSQELERKRFARDLHDGFGQLISVLNLNLKALEKNDSNREEVFENSAQVLDQMYKELKGICFNLMPETLIKKGIIEALKEFALRINRSGKMRMEIDTFGIDKRLEDLQEISLYRITQEWINNILKYSDADKITVSLTKDEEELTLLIEDNGAGFDKEVFRTSTGNGWKNMNSRANLIKGDLELDTSLGYQGSTLIVNAPVYKSEKILIS